MTRKQFIASLFVLPGAIAATACKPNEITWSMYRSYPLSLRKPKPVRKIGLFPGRLQSDKYMCNYLLQFSVGYSYVWITKDLGDKILKMWKFKGIAKFINAHFTPPIRGYRKDDIVLDEF